MGPNYGEYTYDFMPTSVAPQHVFSVIFVRLLFADVEGTFNAFVNWSAIYHYSNDFI